MGEVRNSESSIQNSTFEIVKLVEFRIRNSSPRKVKMGPRICPLRGNANRNKEGAPWRATYCPTAAALSLLKRVTSGRLWQTTRASNPPKYWAAWPSTLWGGGIWKNDSVERNFFLKIRGENVGLLCAAVIWLSCWGKFRDRGVAPYPPPPNHGPPDISLDRNFDPPGTPHYSDPNSFDTKNAEQGWPTIWTNVSARWRWPTIRPLAVAGSWSIIKGGLEFKAPPVPISTV